MFYVLLPATPLSLAARPSLSLDSAVIITLDSLFLCKKIFNHSMATLKPQSHRPPYSNTVIGTVAVDGRAINLVQRGGASAGCGQPSSHNSMWHYNYLCTLKG